MFGWTLACTPPQPASPAPEPVALAVTTPPVDAVLTPPPVLLDAGPLAPGIDATFRVRTLAPLENAYVTWSSAGPGDGPCVDRLAGACLGLRHPAPLVGPGPADLSYSATVVTPWTRASGPVFVQAVVFRLDGTVATTTVLERPVYDPARVRVGDVTLASAADVAALAGIQAITGSLTVGAVDELSLPELEQIGGDLVVWENDALGTLDLPALAHVAGDVSLYADPALTSLEGLSALESVGGELSLNRLDGLTDLDGLESLRIVGSLYVFHDVNLRVAALPRLTRVGTTVELWEDYALRAVRFPALRVVGTKLDLFELSSLSALELPAVERLGGYELHHCDAMTSAGHFPALREVSGALTLQYDPALADLGGLGALETAGAVLVRQDAALTSLASLGALSAVTTDLEVTQDDALVDLGLPALASVGGTFAVTDNPVLSQCAAEVVFDRVSAGAVVCGQNLDDGCTSWCYADTGP